MKNTDMLPDSCISSGILDSESMAVPVGHPESTHFTFRALRFEEMKGSRNMHSTCDVDMKRHAPRIKYFPRSTWFWAHAPGISDPARGCVLIL